MLEGVSDSAELIKRHRDSLERLRCCALERKNSIKKLFV
jgi:hypothetical protein